MRHAKAFTLVELLVVIAIIALLVAIIVPSLGRAKELVITAMCQANLHHITIGLATYVKDNGYYPGHVDSAAGTGATAVWPSRIRGYLENRDLFWCPAREEGFKWQEIIRSPGGRYATAELVKRWGYKLGERMLNVHEVPFSYGYNDWGRYNVGIPQCGLGGDLWRSDSLELPAGLVVSPGAMIAIGETTVDGSWDYNIDPTNPREYPSNIHTKGSNVAFCDGTARWYSQADLVNVHTGIEEGRTMSKLWNNHNQWERR